MEFAASQRSLIPTMVTDPAKAAQIATLTAKSDPGATGMYARELYATDLRPQLGNLTAPTLEVAPVPAKPAVFEGPQSASASMAERADGYAGFYKSLFAGAPNVSVVTIPNSLHFVMIDQPKALDGAIDAFLANLP
jgi:pimeloyl-ACP methyl ester carboxylesterase